MPNLLDEKLQTLLPHELANIYKKLFDSEEGKLMLEDLRNRCFCKTTSYAGSDSRTNFNEGMRAVVLYIESEINYVPEQPETEGQE